MKNKLLGILLCGILILGITGCDDNSGSLSNDDNLNVNKEKFRIGHTLSDGRVTHFTFDVPYNEGYLSEALMHDKISIDEFINKLEFASGMNDGGSKLYRYNSSKKTFGNNDFYVLVCNSYAGIKDIFVAKHIESLTGKCIIKINDLDGVSMTIKEGTLTKSGATIVITDVSSRDNIYGEEYRIDKLVDGEWIQLDVIFEGNYAWTSIGYTVGEDNKLELDVNWEWLYGKLEPGEYRVVKDTSESGEGTTHYITAEFEIK